MITPARARKHASGEGVRFAVIARIYRRRLLDFSNVWLKWIEDRLIHHGIIPDDGVEFCDQPLILQFKVGADDEERIELEVFEYSLPVR